jgi:cell division protein FtsA
LAIGLRVSLDDAERIKVNATDLIKKSRSSAPKQVVITKKKGKSKVRKTSKKVINVSSLNIEGTKEIDKELLEEIIEARLTEIFDLVLAQLEQSGCGASMPAGVVLTGGSAMMPNITKIAKKVFKVPARIGYPKGLDGLADEIASPAYATIQGLILHGAGSAGDIGFVESASAPTGGEGGNVFSKVGNWFRNLIP